MTSSVRARSSAGQGLMKTLMKNCSDPAAGLAFSSVNGAPTRTREAIRPPSGYEGFLSRRQAAAALGFASEFKVRRLEQEGRLRPVRGVMGLAWYPRAQVQALREALTAPPSVAPRARPHAVLAGPLVRRTADRAPAQPRPRRRRQRGLAGTDAGRSRSRTPASASGGRSASTASGWPMTPTRSPSRRGAARLPRAGRAPHRSSAAATRRMERDVLLQQMRDADPTVRAAAFDKLRALR